MKPALLLAASLALACAPSPPEEPSGPAAGAIFPESGSHPSELIGSWEYKGQKLRLEEKGKAFNTVVIAAPNQAPSQRPEAEGRWAVKGEQLFLELNGRTTDYDYRLQENVLKLGKGSIFFDYVPAREETVEENN